MKPLSQHAPLIREYLIEKEKQPQAEAQKTEHTRHDEPVTNYKILSANTMSRDQEKLC